MRDKAAIEAMRRANEMFNLSPVRAIEEMFGLPSGRMVNPKTGNVVRIVTTGRVQCQSKYKRGCKR